MKLWFIFATYTLCLFFLNFVFSSKSRLYEPKHLSPTSVGVVKKKANLQRKILKEILSFASFFEDLVNNFMSFKAFKSLLWVLKVRPADIG